MTSFQKKALRFEIVLGVNRFGSSVNDTVILQGLRAAVEIENAGGAAGATLRARIYGVLQADMNAITTLQFVPGDQMKNSITVTAIDGTAETQVYTGNIVNAWGDYQSMPDVFLHIQAITALQQQIVTAPPTSLPGGADVAGIFKNLASAMGLTFENNGVTAKIQDPYLPGTFMAQARELQQQTGVDMFIDQSTLAITPKNTPRGGQIPLISSATGMRGYPTFDGWGIDFITLFNPAITWGGVVQVQSDIPRANGKWHVGMIKHRMESENPNGEWFSYVRATSFGMGMKNGQ